MVKKMTIESLAQITEERIQGVENEVRAGFQAMKENFGMVIEVMNGLRDDVKQSNMARKVEVAQLQAKDEELEAEIKKIKQKVKI